MHVNEQRYWRTLAKCGGCESKLQEIAKDLFLNRARDGSVRLNGKGVPMGRTYRQVAKLLNEMGFRTSTGGLWKPARTQQFVMRGLARAAAFYAVHIDRNGRDFRRNFEDAIADAERAMWTLFQRKRKAVKGKKKQLAEYGTMVVNGQTVVCDRPALSEQYWAKKKSAARLNGWKQPELWFKAPPEEMYESEQREF